MSFEKTVLFVADESGIENSYFCEGTLFFSADECYPSPDAALALFEKNLKDASVLSKLEYSSVGDEIAVDFKLP